jgi:hypothetical protein
MRVSMKQYLLIVIIVLGGMMSFHSDADAKIKQANVSGQFYPDSAEALSSQIEAFFSEVGDVAYNPNARVVIAPHAGYVYSGAVAAYGYKAVSRNDYNTIVIFSPSHYYNFEGFSVGLFEGFQTPLGSVRVDEAFARRLQEKNDKVIFEPNAFEREHALEVQIPFLQKTFNDFKIVPIVFGRSQFQDLQDFARTLSEVIGDRKDVLIVVSTDMSHFHDDTTARKMDRQTIQAVEDLQAQRLFKACHLGTMELCGVYPVVTALNYAKLTGLDQVDILKYAHSGDVSGDMNRVVGYFSAVIYREADATGEKDVSHQTQTETKSQTNNDQGLTPERKKRLIEIARQTIHSYITEGKKISVQENDDRLHAEEGAFVTLHKHGQLRGCIGNIMGQGPLYLTVRDMAIAAATQDPRFPPVTEAELDQIDIEISVLSKPREVNDPDEIVMGKHGVIVSGGLFHRGVFLPQVADSTGWDRDMFLSQLCSQKAGLPPDAWKDPKTKLEIFTATVFSEKDHE